MIVLNKLAKKCQENCIRSGRVTGNSNHRAYLVHASVMLHEAFDKTKWASDTLKQWSEYEVSAAEVICWMTAFLERLGCDNIEQLIKDVIEYHQAQPSHDGKA